jgi:hypothetical protein
MVPKGTALPPTSTDEVTAGLIRLLALDPSSDDDTNAAAELVARYAAHATAHRTARQPAGVTSQTEVELSPGDLWHELTRDLTYLIALANQWTQIHYIDISSESFKLPLYLGIFTYIIVLCCPEQVWDVCDEAGRGACKGGAASNICLQVGQACPAQRGPAPVSTY